MPDFTVKLGGFTPRPNPVLSLRAPVEGDPSDGEVVAGKVATALGPLEKGDFEINGIRFPVPPQNVSVREENYHHQFETMRTREAAKVRSGKGRMVISVSAIFTGVSVDHNGDSDAGNSLAAINSTLMPILYSLKKMPMCFLDNELLRRMLPIVSKEVNHKGHEYLIGEVIGAFIRSVSVATVAGLPHALAVSFEFIWWNHRPFSPTLRFRKEWIDGQRKVLQFHDIYETLSESQNVNASQRRQGGTPVAQGSAPLDPATAAKEHAGRHKFKMSYGHPARVFNATCHNNVTQNIGEARPLLEYLWPYRYQDTHPLGITDIMWNQMEKFPPFHLDSFREDFTFNFTVPRVPLTIQTSKGEVSIADFVQDILDGASQHQAVQPKKAKNLKKKYPKPPPDIKALIKKAAKREAIEEQLIWAIMSYESGFNSILTNKRSSSGRVTATSGTFGGASALKTAILDRHTAYGLMQLKPAAYYGSVGRNGKLSWTNNIFDKEENINAGVSHLAVLLRKRNGDIIKAIWAYREGGTAQRNQEEKLRSDGRDSSRPAPDTGSGAAYHYVNNVLARLKFYGGTMPHDPAINLTRSNMPMDARDALRIIAGSNLAPGHVTGAQIRAAALKSADSADARAAISALIALDETGFTLVRNSVTHKVAQIETFVLDVPQDNGSLSRGSVVPVNVAVGFGTNLVMTPLEGHRFPTIQYLGGQHTNATISFKCEGKQGRDFVRQVQNLVDASEKGAIEFREFVKLRGIGINNPLLNAVGINKILIEGVVVQPSPGNPDCLDLVLRCIDATMNEAQAPLLLKKQDIDREEIDLRALAIMIENNWILQETIEHTRTYSDLPGAFVASLTPAQKRAYDDLKASGKPLPGKVIALKTKISLHPSKTGVLLNRKGARGPRSPYHPIVKALVDVAAKQVSGITTGGFFGAKVVPGKFPLAQKSERVLKPSLFSASAWIGFQGVKLPPAPGAQGGSGTLVDRALLRIFLGSPGVPGLFSNQEFRQQLRVATQKLTSLASANKAANQRKKATVTKSSPLGYVTAKNTARVNNREFEELAVLFGDLSGFSPGHEAYPDLLLPPNPITGLAIDMTPDFFLFNYSDVEMCNSNTLKVIFGKDISSKAKMRGLDRAWAAIDNGAENLRYVYGLKDGDKDPADGGVGAADRGRKGVYLDYNDGKHHTRSKSEPTDRVPPDRAQLLVAPNHSDPAAVMETGVASRMEPGLRKKISEAVGVYKRDLGLDFHIHDHPEKELIKGQTPENVHKLMHSFEQGEYKRIWGDFANNYQSDALACRRAFPAFKVFFIEEHGEIAQNTAGRLAAKLTQHAALDDFYSVNAVKEIRIVRNKYLAADVCTIQLLDLDGVLYNRKYIPPGSTFGQRKSKGKAERNQFLDTVIKEGMKVVVKFGYSNDPTELETVFVGQIAAFSGNHLVEIICQSYGSELVQQTFGTDLSENADFWNVYTSDLLHDMMDRPELRHFGRWHLKDVSLLGYFIGHNKLRPDGKVKEVFSWRPSVVDDNLFIPEKHSYTTWYDRFFADLEYVFWNTTIWDVFKEMELRHPGYIAYPVPYGSEGDARMTMFFGHPSMEYLSRPAGDNEELSQEATRNVVQTLQMRKLITGVGAKFKPGLGKQAQFAQGLQRIHGAATAFGGKHLAGLSRGNVDDLHTIAPYAKKMLGRLTALRVKIENDKGRGWKGFDSIPSDEFWKATMMFQDGRVRPFRNYEVVTSMHDIISNTIRCDHRGTFNSIELRYSDGDVDLEDFNEGDDVNTIIVNADDNIQEHHIRRTIENWPNCSNENQSRRYASQLLANSLKRTYKGELIIIGKPHLKPYDLIYLYDNYSDMAGPLEVEEVVQTFSNATGFITEIVPNMIVAVKEEATTLMADAMATFFDEHVRDFATGAVLGVGTVFIGAAATGAIGRGVAHAKGTLRFAQLETARAVGAGAKESAKVAARKAMRAGAAGLKTVAVGTGAGVAAGGAALVAPDSFSAGYYTGIATGALFKVHPLIPVIAGVTAGFLAYKLIKYNSTREPIVVTPLIKAGKPFVSGLEGMESDGLVLSDMFSSDPKKAARAKQVLFKRRWRYWFDGIDDAAELAELGWAQWMAS